MRLPEVQKNRSDTQDTSEENLLFRLPLWTMYIILLKHVKQYTFVRNNKFFSHWRGGNYYYRMDLKKRIFLNLFLFLVRLSLQYQMTDIGKHQNNYLR